MKETNYVSCLLDILDYVNSHYEKGDFAIFFDNIMESKNINDKYLVLSSLLDTDINIFEKWYLKYLKECINSDDIDIKMKAKSIYELYEDSFKKVDLCEKDSH